MNTNSSHQKSSIVLNNLWYFRGSTTTSTIIPKQGTLNEKTSCFSLVSFNLPTTNRLLSIVKCESMSSELKCNYIMCVKIDLPVSKSFLDDLSNCKIVKMLSFLWTLLMARVSNCYSVIFSSMGSLFRFISNWSK